MENKSSAASPVISVERLALTYQSAEGETEAIHDISLSALNKILTISSFTASSRESLYFSMPATVRFL